MTYSITFIVEREGVRSTLTTNFAGCVDDQHALTKLYSIYAGVKKIVKIGPANE